MKTVYISFCLLLLAAIGSAQEHDLGFYQEQARVNSPLIRRNQNESKIIALNLKQLENILSWPEINFEAGVLFAPIISHDNNNNRFEWVSAGAEKYTGYDLAATDGGQYQAFVSLKQPLFTKSKTRSFTTIADISTRQNENDINLTKHELEHLVSNQYIVCLKSKMQAEISLELANDYAAQLAVMKKLVENAIYKQIDFMLLQLEHQDFEVEYNRFMADYESNLYDLDLICGICDTILQGVKEVDFQLLPDSLHLSGFLNSYRLDSLNIVANQNIFELKYHPQFNFFANAGMNAIYQPSFNRLGFSTGVALTMNIFDGNQRKLEREKSMINLQTIEFDKNHFSSRRNQSKNKILHQIQLLNQQILLINNQLNHYREIFDVYDSELVQGEISVMEFKNLLKDMSARKQELLILKMEKLALINSYNYWNY